MIWLLAALYRVLRWVGEKAGVRFEGRLSASAHSRTLGRDREGVDLRGIDVSVSDAPCGIRVEPRFDNRSRSRIEVVGTTLRVGRSPTGATVHRLTWLAERDGPPPADVERDASTDEDGGRVAFEVVLPAYDCLAGDPELWLDGTVRFRVRRSGRAPLHLGEIDVPVSPTRLSLDGEELSPTDRERLAAGQATLRERFTSDESALTARTTSADRESGPSTSDRNRDGDE